MALEFGHLKLKKGFPVSEALWECGDYSPLLIGSKNYTKMTESLEIGILRCSTSQRKRRIIAALKRPAAKCPNSRAYGRT